MLAAYQLLVGVTLLIAGVVTSGWWTAAVGALLIVAGILMVSGHAEATSWFRGEMDERRTRAVDHAFRIAFFALAWWVAAVTVMAAWLTVPVVVYAAGIVVAVVVAYVDYALALRRT